MRWSCSQPDPVGAHRDCPAGQREESARARSARENVSASAGVASSATRPAFTPGPPCDVVAVAGRMMILGRGARARTARRLKRCRPPGAVPARQKAGGVARTAASAWETRIPTRVGSKNHAAPAPGTGGGGAAIVHPETSRLLVRRTAICRRKGRSCGDPLLGFARLDVWRHPVAGRDGQGKRHSKHAGFDFRSAPGRGHDTIEPCGLFYAGS